MIDNLKQHHKDSGEVLATQYTEYKRIKQIVSIMRKDTVNKPENRWNTDIACRSFPVLFNVTAQFKSTVKLPNPLLSHNQNEIKVGLQTGYGIIMINLEIYLFLTPVALSSYNSTNPCWLKQHLHSLILMFKR